MGSSKKKQDYNGSYSSDIGNLQPSRLNYVCIPHMKLFTYIAPANMHTNHLVAHSDHHYCKQVLQNYVGIEAS